MAAANTALPLPSLPQEIWYRILAYLDGQSLKQTMIADERVDSMLDDELFWYRKCQCALDLLPLYPKYKLSREKRGIAWKDLYLNLISPYGYLLGCWQRCSDDPEDWRGALLKFIISPDIGLIHGYMSKFNDGAEVDFIKVITLHNDGEFSTHASVEPYPLGVMEHVIKESLTKSCFSSRPSDDHSKYMEKVYTSEVMKFAGLPSESAERNDDVVGYVKLRTLAEYPSDIIAAGVFKARYGSHGDELILLTHIKSANKLLGSKLTGDRNVPCGKHSFVIELDKPLRLTRKQQESKILLDEAEVSKNGTGEQVFIVPNDMGVEEISSYVIGNESTCQARYRGKATLAWDAYTNPWWSTVDWIKFNENVFAVMFMELNHISIFERKTDLSF